MASKTGPDLDGARAAVEALMDDAAIIRYDPQGRNDDQWDHTTGRRIRPNPDSSEVYNASSVGFGGRSLADTDHLGGKCKVQVAAASSIPREAREGGAQTPTEYYNVGLPWDAPIPRKGAEIEIVSSRRDPDLVGQRLVVRSNHYGTFLVSRKILAELRGVST